VSGGLGQPRVHLRVIDSTNEHARRLAGRGAPHGTLVTASEQTAGRGRQGRTWTAPAGRSILCSVVVRDPPRLLPLAAGAAVAEVVEEALRGSRRNGPPAEPPPALVKWPNDVLVDGRKVAGILVEGRPQEGWAVIGVGVNVAIGQDEFPAELQGSAGTLGLDPKAIEPTLGRLMEALGGWIQAPPEQVLEAVRARDALSGQAVRWAGGAGKAAGLDDEGRLIVVTDRGPVALEAGEVHLVRA
jgi:BirA family transcriptional regulator, biotin operon repressor / biotin---[acetyl-CoA-carboxylase] ligase